jgi:AcrR family transcriptional regulator
MDVAAKPPAPAKTAKRRTAGQRPKIALTHAQIIEVALRLIDEQGLADFSVRNVAKALDVFPNAVLWYVGNRNAILAGVTALALDDMSSFRPSGDWELDLRMFAGQFRLCMYRHPHIASLIGGQMASAGRANLPLIEILLRILSNAGFEGAALVDSYNVFVASVVGFLALELSTPPRDDADAWANELQNSLHDGAAAEFPVLAANVSAMEDNAFGVRWSTGVQRPMDSAFAAMLDTVIAGLRATRLP